MRLRRVSTRGTSVRGRCCYIGAQTNTDGVRMLFRYPENQSSSVSSLFGGQADGELTSQSESAAGRHHASPVQLNEFANQCKADAEPQSRL